MKGQVDSSATSRVNGFVPSTQPPPPRRPSADILREMAAPLQLAAAAASRQVERLQALREQLGALAAPRSEALLAELGEGGMSLAENLARAADLLREHRHAAASSAGSLAASLAATLAIDTAPYPHAVPADQPAAVAHGQLPQPLAKALQAAVGVQMTRFNNRLITFVLDIEPGLDAVLDADAWSQVFAALVANSAQHGFRGRRGGEIRVTARCSGGQLLRLIYEDNGIGLSAAAREHAFRRRYTSRAAEGHRGLGLCTVRNIVHAQLNGAIALLEAPTGAAFAIDVPAGPHQPAA